MIEELLNGPWNNNGPAAPHKLLNAYANGLSGFTPLDGDNAHLEQEPDVEPITIASFLWGKVRQSASYCSLIQ
jgi:hypothetical protein